MLFHGVQSEARVDDHNDNLARVVLGMVDLTPEEQTFITALSHKYEALRTSLLTWALIAEHGDMADR